MTTLKTPAVARQLGVSYWQLIGLLRAGRMTPPAKDESGDFQWRPEDVRAARKLLSAGRQAREPAVAS
jgi:hypothetical protein